MIREVKMYWKIRPYLNQEKELSKMKLSANVIAQGLAVAIQAANAVGGMFPTKTQTSIAVITGAVQGIIGLIAHFATPPNAAEKPAV